MSRAAALTVKLLAETVGALARFVRSNFRPRSKLPVSVVNVAEIGELTVPMVAVSAASVIFAPTAPVKSKLKLDRLTLGLTSVIGPSVRGVPEPPPDPPDPPEPPEPPDPPEPPEPPPSCAVWPRNE